MPENSPHIRRHLKITTQTEVMKFVNAIQMEPDMYHIEDFEANFRANAASIMGVMYAMIEFNDNMFLVNKTNDGHFPSFIDQFSA